MGLDTINNDLHVNGTLTSNTFRAPDGSITKAMIASNAGIEASKVVHQHAILYRQNGERRARYLVRSRRFDLDNGAGATVDDAVIKFSKAVTITAARIVYTTETTGTVAGGSAKVGTTLGGAEIVAATNYENAKAVGTQTNMTIVAGAVAAAGAVFVRHTGVAATQAGEAYVELEYQIDEEDEVVAASIPIHAVLGATATVQAIEVMAATAPTGAKSFTVDLKKGSQSTAYASILSGVITYDNTKANRQVVAGTISSPSLVDGDSLQLVIAVSGASGTQAKDLVVMVWVREDPQ